MNNNNEHNRILLYVIGLKIVMFLQIIGIFHALSNKNGYFPLIMHMHIFKNIFPK